MVLEHLSQAEYQNLVKNAKVVGQKIREALNIVMKVTKCNATDVAKISDTHGKEMCQNPEYVDYLQRCIDWRMKNE